METSNKIHRLIIDISMADGRRHYKMSQSMNVLPFYFTFFSHLCTSPPAPSQAVDNMPVTISELPWARVCSWAQEPCPFLRDEETEFLHWLPKD